MTEKVTINDIARICGVSKATVSYVLNGKTTSMKISGATYREIIDTCTRLGYKPDKTAQALSALRKIPLQIVLLTPWLYAPHSDFMAQMNRKNILAFRTEGIQRFSFACACIVFSLIGVPLAITARRRDTSTGFAIGILVAAVYFMALVFCELSRKSGGITPYIVLWLPNVLCAAFAIWQHQKAKFRG